MPNGGNFIAPLTLIQQFLIALLLINLQSTHQFVTHNPHVLNFQVEKKETTKDSWCEAVYVPVRDCEQVDDFRFRVWLNKLQNGKWYEFRVYAENRQGVSDPSAKSPEFLSRPKDGE